MTIAVCTKCGEFKYGAFNPCPACGRLPVEKGELALSMALTDHFFNTYELEGFRESIKKGQCIRLPDEIKNLFERVIENSGYLQLLPIVADPEILQQAAAASRISSIQVALFDFAEKAFELGHAFVDLRNRVNRECGTFWSLFRNLFRRVNYQSFVGAAEGLKGRIQELHENIEIFVKPSNDAENEFYRYLTHHVDALLKLLDVTLRKFQTLARKAQSARYGPSWQEFQEIVQEEMSALEKCDSSGKALTELYHRFRQQYCQHGRSRLESYPIRRCP